MTSYLRYKQHLAVLDADDTDIESWITVKGNHIPIKKGQSKEDAINNFLERQKAHKNIEKHEVLLKKHTDKYETMKAEVLKYQKKFDEMWTSYEDYQKNDVMKNLAWENNIRRTQLSQVHKLKEKEEKIIKKYKDIINKLDNAETSFKDSGVAKVVNFGKMPLSQAKEAVSNLKSLQSKYPFMKDRLEFVGSQDTKDFKDWYKNMIVETQVMNNYQTIMRGIEQAYETVRQWDNLPDVNKREPYFETRYESAKRTIATVEQYGEEEYAKRWVESHYRTTKRFSSNVWAYYMCADTNDTGSIIFNSNNYDNHGNASGDFHPVGCDTQKSVLDHEFGHSIYYALKLDKPFYYGDDEPLGKMRNFIVNEYKKKKDYIRSNLSLYAATNLSEFFAEAFAEYENNPNPRNIAKTVGEYLEQYKKELADGTAEKRIKEKTDKYIKR